ncbi:MAG TPA: exonuclease domain-containing protein, partial [Ignavibacteria bacterium]|nr:exonuclease domain-containing protein [Ignavibacteria bacterium]
MSIKHNIQDAVFIVCDVETTGLSPVDNRMTEIALIKIEDGEISDRYTTLINPKQYISNFITNLTGITNEDVFDKPEFSEISGKILEFIDFNNPLLIFSGHNVSFDYKFLKTSFDRAENSFQIDLPTLCTCKLARRLLPSLKSKSLSSVAKHFGITQKRMHRAYDDTLVTAKILQKFLIILQEEHDCNYIEDVMRFQNIKIYSGNKKPPALRRIKMKMSDVPEDPGVYFMKSRSDEILYIGKAKNLRDRVSSYFRHNEQHTEKIKKMLAQVASLDFNITDSELSALILESRMIKFHKPRFNTAIKRFRFHPFIKLDIQNDFPKIESVYEIENDGAYYYG